LGGVSDNRSGASGVRGEKMTRSVSGILSQVLGMVAAVAAVTVAAAAPAPADLVLLHGRIHSEDANRSVAQALALRGNTIVAVGSDQMISAFVGPGTRTVDLGGRVVLPGLIDAHVPPAASSQDLRKCSLEDKSLSPPDIKNRVARGLKEEPGEPGQWSEA